MQAYVVTRIQVGFNTLNQQSGSLVEIEHEGPDDWAFNHTESMVDRIEALNPGQRVSVLLSVFEDGSPTLLASREASNDGDCGGFQESTTCTAILRKTWEASTWEEEFPFTVEEDEIVMSNKGYAIVVSVL